ncbi:MAG: transcriptional regulator, partial [Alphaproteobacteria bacterium PA3]
MSKGEDESLNGGRGAAIHFDGWEFRPAQRQLLVQGVRVPIGGRAFEVLRVLVQRRGEVVTKDELLAKAWHGVVVEENNISVQIRALRKLLGAQTITTLNGCGYQLSAASRDDAPELAAGTPPPEPLTELLGRQADLQVVLDRLADVALVTLTGPGGVGKTALAREAYSRRCALLQRAGIWVDLAPVREPQRVLTTLAQALSVELPAGSGQQDALVAALGHVEGLVVLDNCEHLHQALAPLMQRALSGAPGLRWLATSRMPLRLPGEAVLRLEPLSVPADGRLAPAQAIEHGAVALLCKRVADADRRFRLDEANVGAVVALCDRLDGLPLAIEMAAARVAAIGIDAVQGLLGQRLKLSAPPGRDGGVRNATLRDTYDWSYGLLSATEQMVFRRLEPFLGGFCAELAQQVASDDDEGGAIGAWEVLEALASLVDKSLVQRGKDGSGRFYLLESAREHARASLQSAGECQQVQRRHARAVAQRLATAQADA